MHDSIGEFLIWNLGKSWRKEIMATVPIVYDLLCGPFYEAAFSVVPRPSVRQFVRLSVHPKTTICSKLESRRNFKSYDDMTMDTRNCDSKFDIKRSNVNVTWNTLP